MGSAPAPAKGAPAKEGLVVLQRRLEAAQRAECPPADAATEARVAALEILVLQCLEGLEDATVPMVERPLAEVLSAIEKHDFQTATDGDLEWREPALALIRRSCQALVESVESEPLTIDGCVSAPLAGGFGRTVGTRETDLIHGFEAQWVEAWAHAREGRMDDATRLLAGSTRFAVMMSRRHVGGELLGGASSWS